MSPLRYTKRMIGTSISTTNRQRVFSQLVIGVLVYAVILGFFSDYTDIVYTKSFSYLFFAAIVFELMTFGALWLKEKIVARFGQSRKVLMAFGVWLIMFSSKFVFVWVIDMIFGDYVNIHGFFGVLAIVLSMTIVTKVVDIVYDKLS